MMILVLETDPEYQTDLANTTTWEGRLNSGNKVQIFPCTQVSGWDSV